MVDYLGLDMKKLRHIDSTNTGGCSYLIHLGHAAEAIAAGKCSIALITLAGKPRTGARCRHRASGAEADFENAYGQTTHSRLRHVCHAHDARLRHYSSSSPGQGRSPHHAQYNPHAMLKEVVTVEDVLTR